MFGQATDQDLFGDGFRAMFFAEGGQEGGELLGILIGENREPASQAVAEIVLRGGGFALSGFRAGGALRVYLIGGNLCRGGHELYGRTFQVHGRTRGKRSFPVLAISD